MEDSEQTEEATENHSIDELKDPTLPKRNGNDCSNDLRPRRASILKKSSDRPVAKSVSFSSIPGEKKVTNGMGFCLFSAINRVIQYRIIFCFGF